MLNTTQIMRINLALCIGLFAMAGCSALPSKATPTPAVSDTQSIKPVISATGVVNPAEWVTLSMPTSGIIEALSVKEGDQVQAGQVLARLEGKEDLQASISAAKYEVTAAQKALDDLDDTAQADRSQSLQSISDAQQQVRDAQFQLDNFTVPQDQASLATTEAISQTKQELDQARAAFDPYKYYPSTNSTRKDLKKSLDQAQSDYNTAVKRLQHEYALEIAQANLDKALKDFETLKNGPDPKDQAVAQARMDNGKAALASAQSALDNLVLVARIDGTISELYARQGEWVTPGQPILLLADLSHLRVETTDLNEIDAARVHVGDPVKVTFDALPNVELNGAVKSISPKATKGSGVNYTVAVDLSGWPTALRWGMTAFVDIQVSDK